MKKIFNGRSAILSLFHFFIFSILCSCDPVAEGDRYVELDAIEAQRVVLLEEFTGQDCRNCPNAHKEIQKLHEQYGESLISVSIHAGSSAYDEGDFGDLFFKTPEGDTYAGNLGISVYPSGVVNRVSGVKLHTEWASAIRSELERPTNLDIALSAKVSSEGNICVNTVLRPSVNYKAQLQLWVVEDSLVSVQNDNGNIIVDYVHNHVYRASVNGVGGEAVDLQANVFQTLSHSIPLRSYWNASHLSIIAFVYDDKEVIQATKVSVIGDEE